MDKTSWTYSNFRKIKMGFRSTSMKLQTKGKPSKKIRLWKIKVLLLIPDIRLGIWPHIRYPAGYLVRHSFSGRVFDHILSGIRLDIWCTIRYPAGYFARYLVSGWIFGVKSGIRPDIWPDIWYPAGYLASYQVSGRLFCQISGIRSDVIIINRLSGWIFSIISGKLYIMITNSLIIIWLYVRSWCMTTNANQHINFNLCSDQPGEYIHRSRNNPLPL